VCTQLKFADFVFVTVHASGPFATLYVSSLGLVAGPHYSPVGFFCQLCISLWELASTAITTFVSSPLS